MPSTSWTPTTGLKEYGAFLGKKMAACAAFWLVAYLITWFLGEGAGSLFAPMVGGAVGLTIGWWLAEDAVERAGFSGFVLWAILVLAAWASIWTVEGVMYLITGWELHFGRWMAILAGMIISMAAAVWRASADD